MPRYCEEKEFLLKSRKRREYLSYIIKRAQHYGVPVGVAMVPVIESSLNPNSRSSNKKDPAIGMWQMKRAAATDMGLVINEHLDERLDWKKSTDAGLKYIAWLTKKFDGDYNLALLSYNVGIGNINSVIEQMGTKNAWYISRLLPEGHAGRHYLSRYYGYYVTISTQGVCEYETP